MRLIDADKVDFGKVFAGASDFAKDTREAAQSVIDAQPTVGKWIPCTDRLPEKDCDCLVTISDGGIDIRGYSYSKGWDWDGFDRVIAWMELPEPYKG